VLAVKVTRGWIDSHHQGDVHVQTPGVCTQSVMNSVPIRSNHVGDHVFTFKKYTGAITVRDHVMNVTAQLARNSGLKVRVNRKVDTTATDNNEQGDVHAMDFGIPGYERLVWDVSLVSDRISSSYSMVSMVSCNLVTTLTLGFAPRFANSDVIMLQRTSHSHLQSYLLPARFILNFYVSCGCWLTCRLSSTSISLGTKRTSGMSDSSGVGLVHSAIIGMRLALPLHTLQPYELICRYMTPLTP